MGDVDSVVQSSARGSVCVNVPVDDLRVSHPRWQLVEVASSRGQPRFA